MNRKRSLYIGLFVVAAIVILINPFQRLLDRNRRPATNAETTKLIDRFIESSFKTPQQYIISGFTNHEIVFLGEPGQVRQHLLLLQSLVPALYGAGVHTLGVEFALAADQDEIDRLVTSPVYDEKLAQRLLFDYLVVWGFQEYADVFKAAWELNRSLAAGSPPFRILGLSVAQGWQYVKSAKDADNAETLHKVFANGIPDLYIAQVIKREIIDKQDKALIYTNVKSAWTRYVNVEYAQNMQRMGFEETRRAGNIVYDWIGPRCETILLHSSWPRGRGAKGGTYPLGGAIDAAISALPPDKRLAGFDVAGGPLASFAMAGAGYADDNAKLTFGEFCDGYVIDGRLGSYRPVTPIPDFINTSNIALALTLFPGPKVPNLTASQLNTYVAQATNEYGRYLRGFE